MGFFNKANKDELKCDQNLLDSVSATHVIALNTRFLNELHGRSIGDASFPDFPFVEQAKDNSFTLGTAKWLMTAVQYAYENYKNNTEIYPEAITNAAQLYWHNKFTLKSQDALCGFLGTYNVIDDGIQRFVIGLRGTNSPTEWASDASFGQVDYNGIAIKGKVEKGFYDILTDTASSKAGVASLQDQIFSKLTSEFKDPTGKGARVYISGHSLGAAVASLIAYALSEKFPELEIISYTYASPRVGDPEFADTVSTVINARKAWFLMQRVFNTSDVVPGLPPVLIKGYVYQHTDCYVYPAGNNQSNQITGFGFSINTGKVADNHEMCTYLEGTSKGLDKCQPPSAKTEG